MQPARRVFFSHLDKARGAEGRQPEEDLLRLRRRRRCCYVDGMMTVQVSSDKMGRKVQEVLHKAARGATGT